MAKNYWGYRIYTKEMKYFNDELEAGRLRQGWGSCDGEKLPDTRDKLARRNLPIYNKVKKGDILLIPRLPTWFDITIAEATEDFDKGYKFEVDAKKGDFGHIFPVKRIKHFRRDSKFVYAGLKRTLKNMQRFWQINGEDVYGNIDEIIVERDDANPYEGFGYTGRFNNSLTDAFENSFNDKRFKELIMENAKKHFANSDWEFALVEALKVIYPSPYFEVMRVGGPKEKEHGTDILIKIISRLGDAKYGIAIQVKDWEKKADEWAIKLAIDQLNKADDYWGKDGNEEGEGIKLIDKILIIARMNYEGNEGFKTQCYENNITPLFAEELSEILYVVGKTTFLCDSLVQD